MSIQADINTHLGRGRLIHVRSLQPGDEVSRTMFVGEEIYPLLNPAALPANSDGFRQAHVRPQLDIFIGGEMLNVALDPRNKNVNAHIARTDPVTDEIWDIRCTDPNARIRVFGRFVMFNTFVALTWEYRENLEADFDWTKEQERFKGKWRELFPSHPLWTPSKETEYVSEPFRLV